MRLVPFRRLAQRRFRRRVVVTVVALLACAVPAAMAMRPIPLDWKHTVGDPSVVKAAKNYVVIATGAKVNRGLSKNGKVWKWKDSALPVRPSWSRPGDIWAADMAKVGSRYVLYFAAPVRGRTASSRCIGVATSHSASGTFVPVAGPPLVCPTWSGLGASDRVLDAGAVAQYDAAVADFKHRKKVCRTTPTPSPSAVASPTGIPTAIPTASDSAGPSGTASASDPASPTTPAAPSSSISPSAVPGCPPKAPKPPQTASNVIGAIDPSLFVDDNKVPYLVYKTDGRPSSIRILQLSGDGLHPATSPTLSQTLVSDAGVLENPVMVHRGGRYFLFNSYGDYARCTYRTVWRSSPSLLHWTGSAQHTLLSRYSTHKLCGPGGADVVEEPSKVLMYFEAWTCHRSYKPCPKNFWSYSRKYQRKHPVRALYGLRLGFRSGAPYVKKYLKGSKR